MVQYRITTGDPHETDLTALLEGWNEPYTAEAAPELFVPSSNGVYIDESLRDAASWASVRSWRQRGPNRVEFELFFHALTMAEFELEDGSHARRMDVDDHTVRVRATNDENGVVCYLTGLSAALPIAKKRLALRLYPERKRGGLLWLRLASDEIYEVLNTDLADPDAIFRAGYDRGDGRNDVHLNGTRINRSPLMPNMDTTHIRKVEYSSADLDERRVSVNGNWGSVSTRDVTPDELQEYVERVIIPIIRAKRGSVRRLDD